MVVQPNKAVVGANAFAHESGIHQDGVLKNRITYEIMDARTIGLKQNRISLGKLSGRNAFRSRLEELGYTLSPEDLDQAFRRFKELADRKRDVTDLDLQTIVSDQAQQVDATYKLKLVQVSCGTNLRPTATVTLEDSQGGQATTAAIGTGPVDAVCRAIDELVKVPNEMVEFSIQAVTEGIDSLGVGHHSPAPGGPALLRVFRGHGRGGGFGPGLRSCPEPAPGAQPAPLHPSPEERAAHRGCRISAGCRHGCLLLRRHWTMLHGHGQLSHGGPCPGAGLPAAPVVEAQLFHEGLPQSLLEAGQLGGVQRKSRRGCHGAKYLPPQPGRGGPQHHLPMLEQGAPASALGTAYPLVPVLEAHQVRGGGTVKAMATGQPGGVPAKHQGMAKPGEDLLQPVAAEAIAFHPGAARHHGDGQHQGIGEAASVQDR